MQLRVPACLHSSSSNALESWLHASVFAAVIPYESNLMHLGKVGYRCSVCGSSVSLVSLEQDCNKIAESINLAAEAAPHCSALHHQQKH